MSDDPGAKIKRLAERLREEAGKAGLTLRGFSFIPNMTGDGPDTVQAAFTLDGDPLADTGEDQKAYDDEFNRMLAQQKLADSVTEAREALQRRLQEGGDLLDDDD